MPNYPENKLAQLVVKMCENYQLKRVVISPGSRNAPLIIGFNNSKQIESLSVVDERSAAFFALGIAQQTQQPVGLVCTSGSALLNYYPAISEAFYNNIPLVVLSADRPKHLIDIGDGQTIRQENVFENHILYSANLTSEQDADLIENALKMASSQKGPVHINIPFNEPLYNVVQKSHYENLEIVDVEKTSLLDETPMEVEELEKYASIWNHSTKKMVLVGEKFPNKLLQTQLEHLAKDPSVLILVENTSNVFHPKFINSIDKLIFPFAEDELDNFKPDILVTIGGMVVSKKIKQHLRDFQPTYHWHVNEFMALNTFHCLTHHFKISSDLFFSQFFFLTKPVTSNYQNYWLEKKEFRLKKHEAFLKTSEFSDLKVFDCVLRNLPKESVLQLSNSSVIRYAQLFDIDTSIQVFCNRGTSGIDGSTSTAVGAAFASSKNVVFITGDISFFYDSNALWNSYIPATFRIILINNQGGGIFRFIPGPANSGNLSYFETPHNLTAKHLCAMHNIEYLAVENQDYLTKALLEFYLESEKPKLLEISTPREQNDVILKAYFNNLKG